MYSFFNKLSSWFMIYNVHWPSLPMGNIMIPAYLSWYTNWYAPICYSRRECTNAWGFMKPSQTSKKCNTYKLWFFMTKETTFLVRIFHVFQWTCSKLEHGFTRKAGWIVSWPACLFSPHWHHVYLYFTLAWLFYVHPINHQPLSDPYILPCLAYIFSTKNAFIE